MQKWLALILALSSCSMSPVVKGAEAEENKYNISQIHIGMTQQQVYDTMGEPYSNEMMFIDCAEGPYEVWYYITEQTELTQRRIYPRHLTPLFFQDGVLKGWGYKFYLKKTDELNKRKKETLPSAIVPAPTPAPPSPAPAPNPNPSNPNAKPAPTPAPPPMPTPSPKK